MKNDKVQNVYFIGGERHIREVRRCDVFREQRGRYVLRLRIRELGQKDYTYAAGDTFVTRDRKKYHLDPPALAAVTEAIRTATARFSEMIAAGRFAAWQEYRLRLYYARREDAPETYDFLLVYRGEGECYETREMPDEHSLPAIFFTLEWRFERNRQGASLVAPKTGRLAEHPLYRAAVAGGDRTLAAQMARIWGEEDEETDTQENDGVRRLPRLREGTPRRYAVLTETIDFPLLVASGYRLLHRPHFAMWGQTHAAYMLDPYNKVGVDAAPLKAEPMPFLAYLALFDRGAAEASTGDGAGEPQ